MKTRPDISSFRFDFPLPQPRSPRTRQVARWFGLSYPSQTQSPVLSIPPDQLLPLLPLPGKILLITGPSGAGKSSLLRAIVVALRDAQPPRYCIDLNTIELPDRPLVDCFGQFSLRNTLKLLSRVGLAEAWTYLRTPGELSEGQRWRLRLARALHETDSSCQSTALICDEFAAVLDRVTAAVVARSLRRAVSSHHSLCAVVATSHDDLFEALQPDLHVRCDFGSIRCEMENLK